MEALSPPWLEPSRNSRFHKGFGEVPGAPKCGKREMGALLGESVKYRAFSGIIHKGAFIPRFSHFGVPGTSKNPQNAYEIHCFLMASAMGAKVPPF